MGSLYARLNAFVTDTISGGHHQMMKILTKHSGKQLRVCIDRDVHTIVKTLLLVKDIVSADAVPYNAKRQCHALWRSLPASFNCSAPPSFDDFVEWMAENMRNPDEHFKPQAQQCDFWAGAFPPHSILRVENISEWYGRAVHALGLRDDTLDGWPTSDGCFYKCPGASCSDMLTAIDSCAASSQACGPNPRCAAAAAGALLDKTGRLSRTAAEASSIAPATLRRLQTYYAEDFCAFGY